MIVVMNLILGGIFVFLILHYWLEKRKLKRFVLEILSEKSDEMESVFELAGIIYAKVSKNSDDPSFIPFPLLSSLGGTPIAILRRGGCCSGLSRLTILSLSELDLRAAQITLYHVSGRAQHALVEVCLDEGEMIVDPTYGFYYVGSKEKPLGMKQLRKGGQPIFRKLPHSTKDSYPPGGYYDFDFKNTKTANWTKSWIRKRIYRFGDKITKGRIDYFKLPPFLEWPQLILASVVGAIILISNLIILL